MFGKLLRRSERGQIIPLMAFGLVALIGAASLAVDVGYWRYQQRVQQSATDSAAIAAGIESDYVTGSGPTAQAAVSTAGRADAATNGFTDGTNNATVTVNYPPKAPDPYATTSPDAYQKYSAVEVVVSRIQPQFFSGIFGGAAPVVRTRAVALATSNNSNCVYALNKNNLSNAGITIQGGGAGIAEGSPSTNYAIYAPTCGIVTDNVLTVTGSAANIADATIGFVKNSTSANANFVGGQPAPANIVPDPCYSIPACSNFKTALSDPNSPHALDVPKTTGVCSIGTSGLGIVCTPGVYNATLTNATTTLPFISSSTIDFLPGVYVLNAGLSFSGNVTSTPNALAPLNTGVTFYNAGATSQFSISGNVSLSIAAPTAAQTALNPFTNLVYYQGPNNPSSVVFDGRGSGSLNLQGVIYAPAAQFTLNGTAPGVSALVADSIKINGGGIAVAGPNTSATTRRHFVLAE